MRAAAAAAALGVVHGAVKLRTQGSVGDGHSAHACLTLPAELGQSLKLIVVKVLICAHELRVVRGVPKLWNGPCRYARAKRPITLMKA